MKKLTGFLFAIAAGLSISVGAESPTPVYVQFIWGTDREAQNSAWHEIGPKLSRKLSPVFRWKHFWELDRKKVSLPPKKLTRVDLQGDRKLELQLVNPGEMEVRLYRRSGLVTKTRHTYTGQMFILGGEEDNRESFFVVIRPDAPLSGE